MDEESRAWLAAEVRARLSIDALEDYELTRRMPPEIRERYLARKRELEDERKRKREAAGNVQDGIKRRRNDVRRLYWIDGLPLTEIARRVGWSYPTIKRDKQALEAAGLWYMPEK